VCGYATPALRGLVEGKIGTLVPLLQMDFEARLIIDPATLWKR